MSNRIKILGVAILAAMFTAGISFGQTTYTWNGTAGDGNWSNTANWASGILPVDDTPGAVGTNEEGISTPYADIIEFSGTTMPTNNLPGIGGYYNNSNSNDWGNTPKMVFNSGGEIDINFVGRDDETWTNPIDLTRDIMTIGDGTGGGTEDVTVNWTGGDEITRHNDGVHNLVINSDGTLNRSGSIDFGKNTGRYGTMEISGGSVIASGTIYDLTNITGPVVDFSAVGGSLQAAWGGNFADIAAVEASIGTDFLNTSGVAGSEFVATSVGSGWKLELLSSNDVANLTTTYTWTGTAGDQDWLNASNWDANGIPVDDTADTEAKYAGLTLPFKHSIVFDGTMMPTSNIPLIGNWYDNSYPYAGNSPMMVFNSGGEIDLDVTKGQFSSFVSNPNNDSRSILTVGDGIGGGMEDVIVNVLLGETNNVNGVLNRHNNGRHDFTVKSDGTLNIEHATSDVLDVTYNTGSRAVTFTIEGGAVVINDQVKDLHTASYVSFTTPGGTFTAKYGQQFPDITDVWDSLGTVFLDNTGNPLGTLQAVDVDGTNFTVSVVATAIQWGSAQGITGDADVSVEGNPVYAYNAGSSDTTVNGVLFTGAGSSTTAFGSDITLTSFTGTTTGFGGSLAPYDNLFAEIKSLLSSAVTNGAAASAITLNNLTIGKRYQVQVWVNDSSIGNTNAQPVILSIGTANAVELDCAIPDAEGALGQYGIGTFVADATSQTFALGSERLQLNAIQVRQVNDINVGFWTGTGGATWDATNTANFAVNKLDEALSVATFDVAKAVNGTVTFADTYFDSGSPVAVTENSITIDGTVEADKVQFVADTVNYTVGGGVIAGSTAVEVTGDAKVVLTMANNTYTGGTTFDGVVVDVQSGTTFGTGDLTLDNGATLGSEGGHLNLTGLTGIVLGSGGGTLQNKHSNAIYSIAAISGAGMLTLDGNGSTAYPSDSRIQLTTDYAYTGGTRIQNKANAVIYTDGALGAADTKVTIDDGRMVIDANGVDIHHEIEIGSGGGTIASGGRAVNYWNPLTGTGALEMNGQNRDNDDGTPGGEFRMLATGTLTGAVTVRETMTVRMGADNVFGTGTVTVDEGVTLQNNDSHTVLDNNLVIGASGAELKAGWSKSLTFNGDLSGSGDLTILADSGTVYLNGASTLSGLLTIQDGAKVGIGPNSAAGALTMESTNSVLLVDVGATSDSMAVAGNVILTNATLSLSGTLEGAGATIMTYGGTIDGIFDGYPEGAVVQPGYVISYLGGEITIGTSSPVESPTVESSIEGGVVTLTWPNTIIAGDQFNVYTNADLQHGAWGVDSSFDIYDDGGNFVATNSIGIDPTLFYKLEYP